MVDAYPLQWPDGWPRTPRLHRRSAPFQTSMGASTAHLLNQLRMMRARNVVISSNLRTYRKSNIDVPYADQGQLNDEPGVAVYFTKGGKEQCIPCDRWHKMEHNLRAIGLTIEALRGLERWGAKEMVDAAFRGFTALPPPDGYETGPSGTTVRVVRSVHEILGIPSEIQDAAYLEYQYKQAAKRLHPDTGGSVEAFQELQEAWTNYKQRGA